MFGFLKNLFLKTDKTPLAELIHSGAFLVDVRSRGEFASRSAKGAVNIPLNQLSDQLMKFKNKSHIVVFCASGMRSAQAKNILKRSGITNVTNGKSWQNVNRYCK